MGTKLETKSDQWLIAKREEIDRRLDHPGIPIEMLKVLVDAGAKVDAEMDRRGIDPYDGPLDADTGVPIA